jgi:hypothetical protein
LQEWAEYRSGFASSQFLPEVSKWLKDKYPNPKNKGTGTVSRGGLFENKNS